jgi:NAD(P)H-dependent FMN reductase|tara:strand:- start:3694 stop:4227 length:534 start_codon:yes stop_codon:yes gene_type:complete
MKKIVAFGASSSKKSINKILANFAAKQIEDAEVNLLDLNDFEMPIYSVDYENEIGIPEQAYKFKNELSSANGIIISFAEHNGSYTAAFKNIFDWISRVEKIVWFNKPMFLLATSDGARGAITVLKVAHDRISKGGQLYIPSYSLPNFSQNFDDKLGIIDENLKIEFNSLIKSFSEIL